MTAPAPILAALGLAAALAATAVSAQTWEYKSYKKPRGGQYDPNHYVAGTVSVEDKDGKPHFRMNAGNLDVCYRGALPAVVTKTAETTIIEVEQVVSGCEQFRYTIRNDGSGGIKEIRNGERWVKSRFDHGLTPVAK
jgi:hypothetical protein